MNASPYGVHQLIAALSKLFPAHVGRGAAKDQFVVFIELPTGQVSWHIPIEADRWFTHLNGRGRPWDGHSTEEKYARLEALQPRVAPTGEIAQELRRFVRAFKEPPEDTASLRWAAEAFLRGIEDRPVATGIREEELRDLLYDYQDRWEALCAVLDMEVGADPEGALDRVRALVADAAPKPDPEQLTKHISDALAELKGES